MAAFGGAGSYHWAEGDGERRATWTWEEESGAAKAPVPGASRPARPTRAVRLARAAAAVGKEVTVLDIRCRHIDPDPAWRTIVVEQLAIWARRYPKLTRLRVTLSHGRHHRRGIEEAAAQAVLGGRVLHATREAETMSAAIRETLRAIGRELLGGHRGRRGLVRARSFCRRFRPAFRPAGRCGWREPGSGPRARRGAWSTRTARDRARCVRGCR